MKSMLNTLDILLGHLAAGIMAFLLYLSLGAVAILSLISIPIDFFEYGAGISELDLAEIGVFTCLCIVIWRFYRRGSQLHWTWWQMLRRFVYAVSSMALLTLFIGFFVVLMELMDKGWVEIEFISRYEEVGTYVSSLLIILTIYAAAPLPKLWQQKEAVDKATEPSVRASESVSESIFSSPEFSAEPTAQRPSEVVTADPFSIEVQTNATSAPVEGKP
jgi:hypothetical protein